MKSYQSVFAALSLSLLVSVSAGAQQITGVAGLAQRHDDDSTASSSRRRRRSSAARSSATPQESKPYWPARIVPPKGAPNVLLIMTDDVGFGVPEHLRRRDPDAGARPHRRQRPALHELPLDRAVLADARGADHRAQPPLGRLRRHLRAGDRLSRLRQHHHQGQGDDRPILKDNGYRTSWFGKNHNTPAFQASQAGPFDQWPIGMGFEYFYGFMGGDTNQWQPATSSATPRPSIPSWASPART